MKNKFLIIFFSIVIISCNDSYEKEELKAIEDITNDYLKRNDLDKILNPPKFSDDQIVIKPNIDTLNIKVYLSDALLPISQIKEDNEWMFKNNSFSASDSIKFYGIRDSKTFKKLEYIEINKSKIKLIKPYRQFEKSQIKVSADEEYKILKFSRVCFDEKRENGIVVVEYLVGYESGTMSGFHGALLIKKVNNQWTFVGRK